MDGGGGGGEEGEEEEGGEGGAGERGWQGRRREGSGACEGRDHTQTDREPTANNQPSTPRHQVRFSLLPQAFSLVHLATLQPTPRRPLPTPRPLARTARPRQATLDPHQPRPFARARRLPARIAEAPAAHVDADQGRLAGRVADGRAEDARRGGGVAGGAGGGRAVAACWRRFFRPGVRYRCGDESRGCPRAFARRGRGGPGGVRVHSGE